VPSGQGPGITVSGRFVQTSVSATVQALLSGSPIPARSCDSAALTLRPGTQEVLISPGPAFIADGVQFDGPLEAKLAPAPTVAATIGQWSAERRDVTVDRSAVTRLLVVPESVNPGWVAHSADGAALTPVIVNGWQQGWVVPAGEQGRITLSFPSDRLYRAGLATGLALLPVLLALALIPGRRAVPSTPATPWNSRLAAAGALLAGTVISGLGGAVVFGGALAIKHWRPTSFDRAPLWICPIGMILAGSLLSRYPWRSVDGYIGHSAWVQVFALVAVGVLAASAVPLGRVTDCRSDSPQDRPTAGPADD